MLPITRKRGWRSS